MNENSCCFTEPPSLEPPILPADFHVTFRGASSTEKLINSPAWSCSSSGQGGSASATMRSKPFLFLIQVSYLPGDKSFKSNNVFLVLLPCPQCLERIVVICLHLLDLLSLCDDVESNPGPKGSSESVRGKESSSENLSDRSLLLEVLAGQKELMKRMDTIDSSQKDITNTLAQFKDRLESLECGLEYLSVCQTKVADVELHVSTMKSAITSKAEKVDDLENRSRRNNIIIHGVSEPQDETLPSLTSRITDDFFKGKLDLNVTGIERCHRLGSKRPNKTRPVIVKLIDYREKLEILRNCVKPKDSGLYVTEDFSQKVRQARKNLWDSKVVNRERNERVKLLFDKVSVNGKLFVWDEAKNDMVALPRYVPK
ncbi:hypothetical protein HPB51_009634 [Rhipicephalus microplus]|uniref:Uncharacterized protein n=1 Tax=Rhipicephalus microplus TaxID=6941 RepID=A0A9J6E914_RHIMP|nr:hypothetical protein HPB51_009634 [Rhipicephalus microplus]